MEKSNNKNRISWQFWLVIWVAGIAGQLVWSIENQWFNTFVYDKIAPNPTSLLGWWLYLQLLLHFLLFFAEHYLIALEKEEFLFCWDI